MQEVVRDFILSYRKDMEIPIWNSLSKDDRFQTRITRDWQDVTKYTHMIAGMMASVLLFWPLVQHSHLFKRKLPLKSKQIIDAFEQAYPFIFYEILRFHRYDISIQEILGEKIFNKIVKNTILFIEKKYTFIYDIINENSNIPINKQDIMTFTQLSREDVRALIEQVGLDVIREETKNIEIQKKKDKDLYSNFSCRILRKYHDWCRHYYPMFGSVSINKFMGDLLVQNIDQRLEKYPMLPQFGKKSADKKPGRKKKISIDESSVSTTDDIMNRFKN